MSQRPSGYARKANDLYETPEWVTEALLPYIPANSDIWEPACGSGKMAAVLRSAGHYVLATDIAAGRDFLKEDMCAGWVVTNPPYDLAAEFISHALGMACSVAMLLRTDFDHAKTRRHLFGDCPQFAKKIVLTRRIKWFEGTKGSPSFNHAWFIWDYNHKGPPTIAYA